MEKPVKPRMKRTDWRGVNSTTKAAKSGSAHSTDRRWLAVVALFIA
jgi:hypothetical protein